MTIAKYFQQVRGLFDQTGVAKSLGVNDSCVIKTIKILKMDEAVTRGKIGVIKTSLGQATIKRLGAAFG